MCNHIAKMITATFSLATLIILMKLCKTESGIEKNPIAMTIVFIFICLMYKYIFM